LAQECPDACSVRLEHLEGGHKETKEVHSELFSKINAANACISKRVKTITLLGLAGVIVLILGGAFMLLYNQGTGIAGKIGVVHQRITGVHDNLHQVELKVIKVQEQVKAQTQVQEMMKEDIQEIKKDGHGP